MDRQKKAGSIPQHTAQEPAHFSIRLSVFYNAFPRITSRYQYALSLGVR